MAKNRIGTLLHLRRIGCGDSLSSCGTADLPACGPLWSSHHPLAM